MFKKSKKCKFGVMQNANLSTLFGGGNLFSKQANMFSFNQTPLSMFIQPHMREDILAKIRSEISEASTMLYNYAHTTYGDEVLSRIGLSGNFPGPDGKTGNQRLIEFIAERVKGTSINRNKVRPVPTTESFVKPEDIERVRMSIEREVSERSGVKLTNLRGVTRQSGRGISQKKVRKISDTPIDYKKEYGHETVMRKKVVPPRGEATKRATVGLIYDKNKLTTFDRATSVYCSKCGGPLGVVTETVGKQKRIKEIESPCPNCGKEVTRYKI